MAFDFQVAIDCAEPHVLADWWAEALGWQVEPQDEAFIRRMIAAGHAAEEDTLEYRGALVWKQGAALTSPDPGRPRVLFQQVPEAKTVKNRVHLDLIPDGTRDAEVARLVEAGARQLDDRRQPDGKGWVVLADPEGNELCILRGAAERSGD